MVDIVTLEQNAKRGLNQVTSLKELEALRVSFLGKKGHLTQVLKSLSTLSADQRKQVASEANRLKSTLLSEIADKKQALERQEIERQSRAQAIDVTLPANQSFTGGLHPVTHTMQAIEQLFAQYGFETVEGPEIEDNFHNFTALNIPEHHPARAMHDTFYFDDDIVLRTHTSPVQIRTLEKQQVPLKVIAPGKVYRCDSDVTHTPMFHQIEGLIVDKNVNFAQLKGLLIGFLRAFFNNDNLQTRFRPSYFPFTEPSAEMDIGCVICNAEGCRVCKHTGWLEVLGCGCVHPNVFANVNISSEYKGLAFGLGVERLSMLKHGINDLRLFFESDLRFLSQFN